MYQPKFSFEQDKKERVNFYASDYGKSETDILLEFMKVEPTNSPEWNDSLKWAAGSAIEAQMLKILKKNGVVSEDYDQDNIPSLKIERKGVTISMRMDAIVGKDTKIKARIADKLELQELELRAGEPIEIKSVNNKNYQDVLDYQGGYPRESYVGQLATYLDALGKDRGHLFVSTIDGLSYFWFVCEKIGEGKYKCANTEVDLNVSYERFAKIWEKVEAFRKVQQALESAKMLQSIVGSEFNISDEVAKKTLELSKKSEPNWFEETYKIPVEQIDFTKLSNTQISDARTNKKVIGSENSWKIMYSPFRDLILEKQGVKERGYTEQELEIIKTKTAGYSSKKKTDEKTS